MLASRYRLRAHGGARCASRVASITPAAAAAMPPDLRTEGGRTWAVGGAPAAASSQTRKTVFAMPETVFAKKKTTALSRHSVAMETPMLFLAGDDARVTGLRR